MTRQPLLATALLALAAASASAMTSTPVIITAEAPNPVVQQSVIARVSNQPAEIAMWHPLRDDPNGLELWILIDDGIESRVGTQFSDIKAFIRQQPADVKIGVGYMRYGSVQVVQKPTVDREAAAKTIRLPYAMPGVSASPYIALADFLHKLPATPQPREIVLISSGIDPYYGPGPQNPYLEDAFAKAQKAGVPVNTIYFASAGRVGRVFYQIDWGQNDLSELSYETGGRFYWEGDNNPVAFKPFFDDLNRRIAGQYVMRVDATGTQSGLERLHLQTETPNLKLTGPSEIYIK